MVSTHSFDLLNDPGIGGEEVLLLSPGREGTKGDLVPVMKSLRSYFYLD